MKRTLKAVLSVILSAAILLGVVASTASCVKDEGYELRNTVAFSTENYEIDGLMAQYLFMNIYSDFYSSYYNYMNYFSLDLNKDLRYQQVRDDTLGYVSEALLRSFYGDDVYVTGTWFDFFWDLTEKEAKKLLLLCEAAYSENFRLTEDDREEIEEMFDVMPTGSDYLEAMYGKGITYDDIRRAVTLTTLANKYYEYRTGRIYDSITDDDVKAYFNENFSENSTENSYGKTKNFGHIVITPDSYMSNHTADEARNLARSEAEGVLATFRNGEMSVDEFEDIAEDRSDDLKVFYLNIKAGEMASEIDEWIYSADRQIGDLEVIETNYGYHVVWFMGDGVETWFLESKSDLYNKMVEEWFDSLTYKVTENKAVADMINV